MFEHRVRLILVGLMFISLFLPWYQDSGSILMWVVYSEGIPARFLLLYYPLLTLFNAYLVFHQASRLKMIYRILLFIYLPFQLLLVIFNHPAEAQIGYWAIPVLASVAALFEVVLMVGHWLKRISGPNM